MVERSFLQHLQAAEKGQHVNDLTTILMYTNSWHTDACKCIATVSVGIDEVSKIPCKVLSEGPQAPSKPYCVHLGSTRAFQESVLLGITRSRRRELAIDT